MNTLSKWNERRTDFSAVVESHQNLDWLSRLLESISFQYNMHGLNGMRLTLSLNGSSLCTIFTESPQSTEAIGWILYRQPVFVTGRFEDWSQFTICQK